MPFPLFAPPVLLGTSVPEKRLSGQMADFVSGLFLLDPFFLAQLRGASGLVRLRDIVPDGFSNSEYFQHHYRYTDVVDEVRFLVPIEGRRTAHVFVEREIRSAAFSDTDVARLSSLGPLIEASVRAHCRWLDRIERGAPRQGPVKAFELRDILSAMGGGALTNREREVVECMLKGHSARSIAKLLEIEEGTVTNHKRNIYAKLEVHSMAQLFNLFLSSLAVE